MSVRAKRYLPRAHPPDAAGSGNLQVAALRSSEVTSTTTQARTQTRGSAEEVVMEEVKDAETTSTAAAVFISCRDRAVLFVMALALLT